MINVSINIKHTVSSQIEDEHIVGNAYNQKIQVKLDSYASKLKNPKIDHQRQQPPSIIPPKTDDQDEHIVGKAYNQELQVKSDTYASKLKNPKIDHQKQQPPSIIPPKTDDQISNDHEVNAHETKSDENKTFVGDSQGLQENPMDIS
ncbi:Hypothetical protein CINCED_3A005230, partial [Cinara cedri]